MSDTVKIPRRVLDKAIECIEFALSEMGGCDHSVGICACREADALYVLKLARGDEDAIAAQRAEDDVERVLLTMHEPSQA